MTRLLVLDRAGGSPALAGRVAEDLRAALGMTVQVVEPDASSGRDLATAVAGSDAILELVAETAGRGRFADVARRHVLAARDRPLVRAIPGRPTGDPRAPISLRPVGRGDRDDQHGHVEVVGNLFATVYGPLGDVVVVTAGTADGDALVALLAESLGAALGVAGTVRHAASGLAVVDLAGRGRHLPDVLVLRDPASPDPVLDARVRGVVRDLRDLVTIPTDPGLVRDWVSARVAGDTSSPAGRRAGSRVRRRSGGSWSSRRRQDDDRAVPVELGASAPAAAPPGAEVTIRVAAFPPRLRDEARGVLGGLAGENRPALEGRTRRWAVGTDVEVRVSATGLDVEAPTQRFSWDDDLADLVFDARVHDDQPAGDVVVRADVLVANCAVARLRLPFTVAASTPQPPRGAPMSSPTTATTTVASTAATTAFASYATVDRPRVRERLAALESLAGLDVFADRDIRPGEDWRRRLRREITTRDLFLLFWSRAAAASTEIRWEMDTAEASPGRDAMRVHVVERNAGAPPGWEHVHVGSTWSW